MDFWQFGWPQTGGWAPGNTSGGEFTEFVGSSNGPINARLQPSIHGATPWKHLVRQLPLWRARTS